MGTQWKAESKLTVEGMVPDKHSQTLELLSPSKLERKSQKPCLYLPCSWWQSLPAFLLCSPLRLCSLMQVDSLSVTPGPLGVPELIVSQPGCAYAVLLCTWNKDTASLPASEEATGDSR